MIRLRKAIIILVAFVLQACASSTTERNLSYGQITEIHKTSVIKIAFGKERERNTNFFSNNVLTWLLSITDLSLPKEQQQPIKLFNAWNNTAGDHPRVSPGEYLVRVGCETANGIVNQKQSVELKINAKAGKMYLLECMNRAYSAPKVKIREVDQVLVPQKS